MPAVRRLLLLALAGCHGSTQPPAPEPDPVQVRDASGAVLAELRALRPCRGSIGPIDLIVGGPPLISNVGSTQWSGMTGANGTTLRRDGDPVARVYPVGDATTAAVLDPHGVALARIAVTGKVAVVSNAASVPVRNLRVDGDAIKADQPAMTITGTHDLVLAALLSAPELTPEVRVLAACERVLVKDK
jgi:hypothetical protein